MPLRHREDASDLDDRLTTFFKVVPDRRAAVRLSMNDYLRDLRQPANNTLRSNLWTKMDHICNIRKARGANYAVEPV